MRRWQDVIGWRAGRSLFFHWQTVNRGKHGPASIVTKIVDYSRDNNYTGYNNATRRSMNRE